MKFTNWVDLELRVTGLADAVRVRIDVAAERSVASVHVGSATTTGLGATARDALVAALSPFGARTGMAVMAAPDMFSASAQLLRSGA